MPIIKGPYSVDDARSMHQQLCTGGIAIYAEHPTYGRCAMVTIPHYPHWGSPEQAVGVAKLFGASWDLAVALGEMLASQKPERDTPAQARARTLLASIGVPVTNG